jgi:predicted transcriptional regulator
MVGAKMRNEKSIRHEFYRISRVIPEGQDMVTVESGTSVGTAMEALEKRGRAQLLVTVGARVIGIFSYRSLALGLKHVKRNADLFGADVDDFLEDPTFARETDDIGSTLDTLAECGAVLIGDRDRVVGIVTPQDISLFLWKETRPFVLVQDVEMATRSLATTACPDPGTLGSLILRGLPQEKQEALGQNPSVDSLTLGQLLLVVFNGENFGKYFRLSFGRNIDLVRSRLDPVREIRNKVVHFRSEVSAEEYDALETARAYLNRRIENATAVMS